MLRRLLLLVVACAAPVLARADTWQEFSTQGLPGSHGVVVRINRPAAWKVVPLDDPMALAELRGPHGPLTAILQIGRGRQRQDMETVCHPERARDMLQNLEAQQARVTDVFARRHEGRPAFEMRYERKDPPMLVRSVIVCLKDTRLVVSCGATGPSKAALGDIEPVCRQVLGSLAVTEP